MAALDYGYVVTIAKDATSIPAHTPTNQWQRKLPGEAEFLDLPGETGRTYTIQDDDRASDIRLQQNLGGSLVYSNVLTVTSEPAGCPYTPTSLTSIYVSGGSDTEAKNGDRVRIKTHLEVSEISNSNRTTSWMATPDAVEPYSWFFLDYGVSYYDVTEFETNKYEYIKATQDYSNSPDKCDFKTDSNLMKLVTVKTYSFGSARLTGPSTGTIGETLNYELTYDGDVEQYTAAVEFPYQNATFADEVKAKGKYSFSLTYHTPSKTRVKVTLTSNHANTTGENPLQRAKDVETTAPLTLGNASIAGKDLVATSASEPYEAVWDGTATANDVTIQWATDADTVIPAYNVNPSNFTWDAAKDDAFVMAQISCPKCTDKTFAMPEKKVKVEGNPRSGEVYLISGGTFKMIVGVSSPSVIIDPDGVQHNISGNSWYNTAKLGTHIFPVSNLTRLTFKDNKSHEFDFHPDFYTGNIENMGSMFQNCLLFNGDITNWDTSNVTNMALTFNNCRVFEGDISNWNTSKVSNLNGTFTNSFIFNSDLSNWNTSNVTNMQGTFSFTQEFDSDISAWDTSKVETMNSMFRSTIKFNQSLPWNTSNVKSMMGMFRDTQSFNQNLNTWNTSNVTDMNAMFQGAQVFNGKIDNWDTSKVYNISFMFNMAFSFNQSVSNWNTSNVSVALSTFRSAFEFNQPILNWNFSSLTDKTKMYNMFRDASALDQDFSGWCVPNFTGTPTGFVTGTPMANKGYSVLPNWGAPCP